MLSVYAVNGLFSLETVLIRRAMGIHSAETYAMLRQPLRLVHWLALLLLFGDALLRRHIGKASWTVLVRFVCALVACVLGTAAKRFTLQKIRSSFMSKSFRNRLAASYFAEYAFARLVEASTTVGLPAVAQQQGAPSLPEDQPLPTNGWWERGPLRHCLGMDTVLDLDDHSDEASKNGRPMDMEEYFSTLDIDRVMYQATSNQEKPPQKNLKGLSTKVFSTLAVGSEFISCASFKNLYPGNAAFAVDAYGSITGNDPEAEADRLDCADFIAAVSTVFQERSKIDRNISLSFQAIAKIDTIVNAIVFFSVAISILAIFGVYPSSLVALSLSTLLAASYLFGTAFKSALCCVVFVFVTHPFDVGDRVEIKGTKYTVTEIDVFATKFIGWHGEITCIPNEQLSKWKIVNFTRNNIPYECFTVKLPASRVGRPEISRFLKNLVQFLQSHSSEYFSNYSMTSAEDNETESTVFHLRIQCKLTVDETRMIERKFSLSKFISGQVQSIGGE